MVKRITEVNEKVDEVDKKHTEKHTALEKLITKLDITFPQLIKGNEKISEQLEKMNDNLTNQDKRILKVEYDIEDLSEDSEELKVYLRSEQDKAKTRGKETRSWFLQITAVLVGGGGIGWLLSPLIEILKKMVGS